MAWRNSIVTTLARLLGVRRYDAAKSTGHIWGNSKAYASANVNVDLNADRYRLRERSRHQYQNNATARAIVEAKVALVVSSGIDIEPDTGNPDDDAKIHDAWTDWIEQADASGVASLWELQRQAFRSEETAGEFLWIFVDLDAPGRVIPAALLSIEPDRLASAPCQPIGAGNQFVDGVEIDKYGRPVAYHITDADGASLANPLGGTATPLSGGVLGSLNNGSLTGIVKTSGRVYHAARIVHGFDPLRPGQHRGEPRMAPILNTLRQESQLVEYELTAAKVGSAHAVAITTANGQLPGGDPAVSNDGTQNTYEFSPGSVNIMGPGEKAEIIANPRPSQQISPFRQMLRGDLAGASGVPQRFIDRDVGRANYSSMRADMLDTRRLLDPVQHRFGRQAAQCVYLRILPQLAVAAGVTIPPEGTPERMRFERCKIIPDGWAYVDPQKDVAAGIEAIRAGFSTWQEEIGGRGKDPRRTLAQLKGELSDPLLGKIFAEGTTAKPAPPAETPPPVVAADAAKSADMQTRTADHVAPQIVNAIRYDMRTEDAASLAGALSDAVSRMQNNVTVNVPQQPAPIVTVNVPEQRQVEQPAPQITVNVPQQAAPVVNVAASPAAVVIENTVTVPARTVKATPQKDGSVLMVPQE